MYITCPSAQSTWVSSEQNLLTEFTTCFINACLVSYSSSSGTCSPWSPALLSCGGGGCVAPGVQKALKSVRISTGYTKYITNMKQYTAVMTEICYYYYDIALESFGCQFEPCRAAPSWCGLRRCLELLGWLINRLGDPHLSTPWFFVQKWTGIIETEKQKWTGIIETEMGWRNRNGLAS